MTVRAVVGDDVDDHLDGAPVQSRDQGVELFERPDGRVDVAVVVDVVSAVDECRRIERAQPHRVDAEPVEVIDAGDDALEIADAVAVRVGEAPRIDLVDGRVAPPVRGGVPDHPPAGRLKTMGKWSIDRIAGVYTNVCPGATE